MTLLPSCAVLDQGDGAPRRRARRPRAGRAAVGGRPGAARRAGWKAVRTSSTATVALAVNATHAAGSLPRELVGLLLARATLP